MTTLPKLSGIKEVVALGSQKKLAGELGVSPATVQIWVKQGFVPLKHLKIIEELYGVSRARLCEPLILEMFPEILQAEKKE
jgi:DNA-binding transcriptional regulator YdaS (Cro superfamily)